MIVKAEEKIQSQCTQWFWNTFPEERGMLFHIDNNSYNAVIGALKKALGVVRGPSDLCYVLSSGRTVWLECKTPVGQQSESQKDWEKKVTVREHLYIIFTSFEEFKKIINHLQTNQ